MPYKTHHNQDALDELEDDFVVLQALLSCATGVWYSDEDEESQDADLPKATLLREGSAPG